MINETLCEFELLPGIRGEILYPRFASTPLQRIVIPATFYVSDVKVAGKKQQCLPYPETKLNPETNPVVDYKIQLFPVAISEN